MPLWTVDCGLWTVDCGLWAVEGSMGGFTNGDYTALLTGYIYGVSSVSVLLYLGNRHSHTLELLLLLDKLLFAVTFSFDLK